jgi:hypothetical protein
MEMLQLPRICKYLDNILVTLFRVTKMGESSIEPDLTSYEYLVKMFCQELDIEEAERLIDVMNSK